MDRFAFVDKDKATQLIHILSKMIEMVEEKESEQEKPLVLTAKQAAEKLCISPPAFREHFLHRKDFPKVKAGTKILIPYKALEEWINKQGVVGNE